MAEKLDDNGEPIKEKVGGLTDRMFVKLSGGSQGDYFDDSDPGDYDTIQNFDPTMKVAGGTVAKQGWLEFLGFSRIDGYPMFRSFRQFNTAASTAVSGGWGFDPIFIHKGQKKTFSTSDENRTRDPPMSLRNPRLIFCLHRS